MTKKTVFEVTRRVGKKYDRVKDCTNKEEALNVVISHYKTNSKRGNVRYSIMEMEVENKGSYSTRSFTMFQSYARTLTKDQLEVLARGD